MISSSIRGSACAARAASRSPRASASRRSWSTGSRSAERRLEPRAMSDWRDRVLKFWFGLDPTQWWKTDPELDHRIRQGFLKLWAEKRQLPAETFLADPLSALAAVILFDQFPRNMFRGHADQFATDHLALAVAKAAVDRGFDDELERGRALLPLHAVPAQREPGRPESRGAAVQRARRRLHSALRRSIATSSSASAASPTAMRCSAGRRVPTKLRPAKWCPGERAGRSCAFQLGLSGRARANLSRKPRHPSRRVRHPKQFLLRTARWSAVRLMVLDEDMPSAQRCSKDYKP